MWTCLNEKPGRSRLGPPRVGIAQGLQQCLRPVGNGARLYTLPTTTPDGVARASKFAVSKVSEGGGGETRGSWKRHGLGHTFVKWPSLAAARRLALSRP